MIKNKIIKIAIILITIFTLFTIHCNSTIYAVETDPTQNPNYYHPQTISPEEPKVQEKVGQILGIINVVGVIVSVITLMIIGMKYMFGSIEEKAEYKKTIMYYLLGAVLIFSGTTIPNILYKIGTSINTM